MILKLVKTNDEQDLESTEGIDCAYTNWAFEVPSAGKVSYRKVIFHTWKRFRLYTEGWMNLTIIGHGPHCSCSPSVDGCNMCEGTLEYHKCPSCGQRFNNLGGNVKAAWCERCKEKKATEISYELTQEGACYIEIILFNDNAEPIEMILAMQSSLYVMNDQGKTVDTIHAFNG